jgi:general nucleoside transport system permease protein
LMDILTGTLAAAMVLATPLVLAAMGGLINMRGGIVNIGLEGMMVVGAFVAVLVSWKTGSALTAVLSAAAAGALVALPFTLVITRLGANEIVAGLGFNILVVGLIGYLLPVVFDTQGVLDPPRLADLPSVRIPGVDSIPVLGRIVSGKTPLTYLAIVSVPLVAWFLNRTTWGIRLRAAGQDPEAARAVGIRALAWRDMSTMIAGMFSGLAGAQLSIGIVTLFGKEMVAGRGFIALAAFYFGAARPWPTAAAAFLFGVVDALQVRLPGDVVPSQVVQMLPYLSVVVALTVVAVLRRRRAARPVRESPV